MVLTTTFSPEASASLGGPAWLRQVRARAVAELEHCSFPRDDQEIWRYSRINEFSLETFSPLTAEELGAPGFEGAPGGGPIAKEAGERSGLVVVRDGRVVHCELDDSLANAGVTVAGVETIEGGRIESEFGRLTTQSADAFTTLHDAFVAGGAFIHVPEGVVVDKPIVIVHWCEGIGRASFPHTLILADRSSEVTVVERMSSPRGAHLVDAAAEVVVGENASVRFLTVQDHERDTWHFAHQRAEVARDGRFHSAAVALGGDYARLRCEVALIGERADARQVAVYYGDGTQMLDFRTLQDHQAPRTTSNLLFKGAVEHVAHSVYSGMIHLRAEAQRSSAHQTNRNLVLTSGATAESIPNLEIEANDVQCSHASTVGPIDDDQLYYLATRGIEPRDAARLIVLGFFNDVFASLPVPSLVERLRSVVSEKVGRIDS
ncbi:MAG: Fe-S cluster assembly protein SufD [Acidimicrobiia bacterium]